MYFFNQCHHKTRFIRLFKYLLIALMKNSSLFDKIRAPKRSSKPMEKKYFFNVCQIFLGIPNIFRVNRIIIEVELQFPEKLKQKKTLKCRFRDKPDSG